jgi:hypothetical protein
MERIRIEELQSQYAEFLHTSSTKSREICIVEIARLLKALRSARWYLRRDLQDSELYPQTHEMIYYCAMLSEVALMLSNVKSFEMQLR